MHQVSSAALPFGDENICIILARGEENSAGNKDSDGAFHLKMKHVNGVGLPSSSLERVDDMGESAGLSND